MAPLLLAILALSIAGCGDDDEEQPASTGEAQAEESPALAEATDRIEELKQNPTSIPVDEPLETKPNGESVIYVHCGAPICDVYADAMREAAPLLGIEFRVLQPGTQPQEIVDTYNRAIQLDPDGVILAGNANLDFIGKQFQTLVDNGVKVAAHAIPQGPDDTAGLLVNVEPREAWIDKGRLLADIVAVDGDESDTDPNVAFFTIRDFPVFLDLEDGLNEEFPKVCPDCQLDTINASATDIGQKLPTDVTGYIQSHPDVNYLVFALGSMTLGVPEALSSAGVGQDVKVVTQSGSPKNYEDIEAGRQLADIATAGANQGWLLLDQMARVLTDQEIDPSVRAERRIVMADNLDFDITQQWPGSPNFRENFKQLWGAE